MPFLAIVSHFDMVVVNALFAFYTIVCAIPDTGIIVVEVNLLAPTIEDGYFYSQDRGKAWLPNIVDVVGIRTEGARNKDSIDVEYSEFLERGIVT